MREAQRQKMEEKARTTPATTSSQGFSPVQYNVVTNQLQSIEALVSSGFEAVRGDIQEFKGHFDKAVALDRMLEEKVADELQLQADDELSEYEPAPNQEADDRIASSLEERWLRKQSKRYRKKGSCVQKEMAKEVEEVLIESTSSGGSDSDSESESSE